MPTEDGGLVAPDLTIAVRLVNQTLTGQRKKAIFDAELNVERIGHFLIAPAE